MSEGNKYNPYNKKRLVTSNSTNSKVSPNNASNTLTVFGRHKSCLIISSTEAINIDSYSKYTPVITPKATVNLPANSLFLPWIESLKEWATKQFEIQVRELSIPKNAALCLQSKRFKLIDRYIGNTIGVPLLLEIAKKTIDSRHESNFNACLESDKSAILLRDIDKIVTKTQQIFSTASSLKIINQINWQTVISQILDLDSLEAIKLVGYELYYIEYSLGFTVTATNNNCTYDLLATRQLPNRSPNSTTNIINNINNLPSEELETMTVEQSLIYIAALRQKLQVVEREKYNLENILSKTIERANAVELQLRQDLDKQQKAQTTLLEINQELEKLICTDSLTQIANRRQFDDYLLQYWQQLKQVSAPLSLILGDVDYFKVYNDTYGHLIGDYCLQQVALAIESIVDDCDGLAARYGGEEFGMILPNTEKGQALEIAEKIRLTVRGLTIEHQQSPVHRYVTISLGVCSLIPNYNSSPELAIAMADKALYEAKAEGRDRVYLYRD